MKKTITVICLLLSLVTRANALFDTGTAMEQGALEADICINPLESITYGQNWLFLHYGLGGGYEIHGYLSKWGTIQNWSNATCELYLGILKQWYYSEILDLATSLGVRQVQIPTAEPSLIGPGMLYTLKLKNGFRLAGHLQYIGTFPAQGGLFPLNHGFTFEIGLYKMLTHNLELAAGLFTNSESVTRPIYTFNYYF